MSLRRVKARLETRCFLQQRLHLGALEKNRTTRVPQRCAIKANVASKVAVATLPGSVPQVWKCVYLGLANVISAQFAAFSRQLPAWKVAG